MNALGFCSGQGPRPQCDEYGSRRSLQNDGEPIGRTMNRMAVCGTDRIMIVLHAELYNFPYPRAVHHEFMKIREATSSNVSDVIRLGSIL